MLGSVFPGSLAVPGGVRQAWEVRPTARTSSARGIAGQSGRVQRAVPSLSAKASHEGVEKEDEVDAIEAILSRRSIRRYTPEPVPADVVRKILEAGMSAPSAGNEQPWHFVVITARRILDEIPRFHPYAEMLKEAPVAILVCGDRRLERYRDHWIQDCSAATQNLLLAAHALGLGAVWVGIYPAEDRVIRIRTLVSLPSSVVPLCLVPLGYPAERVPRGDRYDPSRVHSDGW